MNGGVTHGVHLRKTFSLKDRTVFSFLSPFLSLSYTFLITLYDNEACSPVRKKVIIIICL